MPNSFDWDQYEEVTPSSKNSFDWDQYEEVTPIKGGVSKNQNPIVDIYNQVSTAPNRLFGFIADPIGDAIGNTLRRITGRDPLTREETQKINKMMRPEASTTAGNVARLGSDIGMAFMLPQAKIVQNASLLNKAGLLGASGAYQGGLLGASGAYNANQDPIQGGVSGAVFGGGLGGGLPALGAGFEKIQPLFARMAGISPESWRRALSSLQSGKSLFDKSSQIDEGELINKIKSSVDEIYPTSELFSPFPNFYRGEYNKLGQQLQKTAEKSFLPENVYNKSYREIAEKISDLQKRASEQYGSKVGREINALTDSESIPYSQLSKIIDDAITKAGRGSELNPAGELVSPLANELKGKLLRGALKNSSMTDDEISALVSGKSLESPEIQNYSNVLKEQGYSQQEINDYLSALGYSKQINLDDLLISQKGLHNVKEFLQTHKINYDADYKPAANIIKDWASGFNQILRENPAYAQANDQFATLRQFLNNPENSWLKNVNSIASKLANANNKTGELNDVIGKIRELESLLPDNPNIVNQLEDILLKQKNQKIFESNIPKTAFTDISRYDSPQLSDMERAALDRLNALSSQNPLEKYQQLSKQKINEEEILENLLAQNKAARKSLPESLIEQPFKIKKAPYEEQKAFELLNQNTSNKFDEMLKDFVTQKEFSGSLPHWADYRIGRAGISGALGISGLAGALNPAFILPEMAVLAQMSPIVQKKILESYNLGQKASPFFVPGSMAGYNQMR